MNPINQSEINDILWRACDTFRGTVDPAEYKNYILVMLFVKYISDVWRDRYEQLLARYDGDQERVQRAMRYEKFTLPADCDFETLYAQRNADNLGEIINIALEAIEEANKEKLEGVFRNIDFNSEAALGRTKQRNERLKNLLNDFADKRLDLRPSRVGNLDVIGNAYEYLIGRFAAGAGKKAGEFYTPPEVSTLLARLVAPRPGDRICDPTSGSGSLLIRCAKEVDGDDYALYGQENNGSTWALAKMNMFLHDVSSARIDWCDTLRAPTLVEGDHHIKCGNSLIGATPELMDAGISTDAFKPVTGDDKAVAKAVRARNRRELKEWEAGAVQGRLFQVTLYEPGGAVHQEYVTIAGLAEEQPKMAQERYAEYLTADDYRRKKLEADFWTAAFFWPLITVGAQVSAPTWTPTHGEFIRLREQGPETLPPEALAQIEALAEQYRFFHWHLEFPDLFADDGARGFDVVLGNPPWERIKLQEKEFFADKDAEIANARTAAERRKLIKRLPQANAALHAAYIAALRKSESAGHFLRSSDRFPLTSGGDINTYAIFAELSLQLVSQNGFAGTVVPTGIATNYTYRNFFGNLMENSLLSSLYDFQNSAGIFSQVDRNQKFVLLTMSGGTTASESVFAFALTDTSGLSELGSKVILTADDISLINPNTRNCPIFDTAQDAGIAKRIYWKCPVLVNENKQEENEWNISFDRMYDMTTDSSLFQDRESLARLGYKRNQRGWLYLETTIFIPLYEGKMIYQFDHRFAQADPPSRQGGIRGSSRQVIAKQHQNPSFYPESRYYVSESEFNSKYPERNWFIGYRDVTGTVANVRTVIFSLIPRAAAGNKVPIVLFGGNHKAIHIAAFLSNMNSFVFDFTARQKISGMSLNYYILQQLPTIPPSRYTPDHLDFIVPRVVELTYTAWDLQAFADDIWCEADDRLRERLRQQWESNAHSLEGKSNFLERNQNSFERKINSLERNEGMTQTAERFPYPPFTWDEERRAILRAELDGLYAHLYGLTREELDYILDTFPIVRRKDEAKYGEYRTKRMVLESYDALKGQFG